MPEGPSRLTIDTHGNDVVVVGDIDAHSAPVLGEALDPLPDGAEIRVRLTGVGFMDSSGLRVIIDAHQRAAVGGRRLVLVDPSRGVRRLIEISGLGDHLHIDQDR